MSVNLQAELILRHLEQYLGPWNERWLSSGNDASPFQVLLFPKQPEPDGQCLVTFGLSAHQLRIEGQSGNTSRMEFAICAASSFDSKELAALLIAVGLDAVTRHVTPGIHGVLMGSGAVLSNPLFEHFYLSFPGYFPAEFELCETVSPPVVIAQLIPITSGERELIERQGWRSFESAMVDQRIDLLAFDTRQELTN